MRVRMDQVCRSNDGSTRKYIPFIGAVSLLWLFAAGAAQAASVSYYLDQSSRLPDGTNYLKVTVDDEGAPGAINFHVQALDPVTGLACDNSGFLKFAFNGDDLGKSNILGLPDGWKLKHDKKMGEFGKYENVLVGKKWNAQDPLSFSIVGVGGDSIYSYATSHDADDGLFFATFFRGLEKNKHGQWHGDYCHRCTKGAYFSGSGDVAPVPVPGAVWLFGSGLAGLIGLASRRRSKPA